MNKRAIDIISLYLKKMMRSVNAVSSHSGLIPSGNFLRKREGLLWPIARKRNLISLRSVAFFTIFVCNLVPAYKFHGYLKALKNRSINIFKNLTIPRLIISLHLGQVSRTLKARKVIKWGLKCPKCSPRFCVYK